MEASVFLGRQVSFHKARQLAFEGDLVGMHKEALKVIKGAGDFTKMNVFQQEKLAAAAGMTVGEVNKQLQREEMLEKMRTGTLSQRKMLRDYEAAQAKLRDGETEDLAAQGEQMLMQEQMQSKMNQLKSGVKYNVYVGGHSKW